MTRITLTRHRGRVWPNERVATWTINYGFRSKARVLIALKVRRRTQWNGENMAVKVFPPFEIRFAVVAPTFAVDFAYDLSLLWIASRDRTRQRWGGLEAKIG